MKPNSEIDSHRDKDPTDLITRLRKAILTTHPEILEAYLFGSRATGHMHPASDIDVGVYIDRARINESVFGYQADLTSDLMSSLHTNAIDLVILNDAPPVLYHRVLRDGIRFISRDLPSTTTREGQALSRYCDYVPHLKKIESALRSSRLDASKQ